MSRGLERAAVASLLIIFFGLSAASVRRKTLTADEPFHHRYGRQILGFDATRFDNSKMPVSAWNAVPCRVGELLGGSFPGGGEGVGRLLCHRTSARLMTTLVALLLGAYIYRWSRLLYGPAGGLLSLTLLAFSPNLIGHGRLVTTDVYAATAAVVAAYHFWRFTELGGRRRAWVSAITLGAAQLAKYSMVWLYPIFIAVLAARTLVLSRPVGDETTTPPDWRWWARHAVGFGVASALLINAGFLWQGVFVPLDGYSFKSDVFTALQRSAGPLARLPVPVAYPYLEGLDWVKQSDDDGNTSGNVYLLGEVRAKRDPDRAFPGYFFVASLFKVPLGTQLLFACALALLARRFVARDFVRRELHLLVPLLVYGIYFNFFLKSQLGIRLFLVVFPFGLIVCGRVLAELPRPARPRLIAVSGLTAWTVVSVLSYFPHYLSYFNELVWDRKMAYTVLADSNLSWGQDTDYLREYVREHPDVVVRPRQPMAGRLVVDVNQLTGVFQRRRLAWLRDHFEPVDRIAGSYLVFDVTPAALEKSSGELEARVTRWLALALAFFATRLYQLALLPLFFDEAVHLRWTVRLVGEGRLDRILVDGKLLNIMLMSATVPWVSNPAWWGRATSVALGAVGLATTWLIGARLFGQRVGWVSAALYIVCPFAFFYDRMALADVYLSSFAALVLYRSLVLQDAPSGRNGAWLGLCMAASVLSKIPGLLTLGFPLLVLLMLGRPKGWARGLGIAYGVFAALAGPFVVYFFGSTEQLGMKAAIPDGGKGRLASIGYNVTLAWDWLTLYWGPTLLIAAVGVAVFAVLRWQRRELVLLAASAVPVVVFVLMSFHWFPRYVLLSTIPFLVVAARGLTLAYDWLIGRWAGPSVSRPALALAVAGLVAWPAARVIVPLVVEPSRAPLPLADRFQYVDGWPSGYAWREAAAHLRTRAESSELGVRVLVERADHRTAIAVLWGYLMNDPRIEILPVDLRRQSFRDLLVRSAHEREAYVLSSAARPEKLAPIPAGSGYRLDHARSFHKPDGRLVGRLFRVLGSRPSESVAPGHDPVEDPGRQQP